MDGFAKVRDQILAEAYVAFKKGEELYLRGDLAKLAEIEQYQRMHADPWQDVIGEWLKGSPELENVSVSQIYELALGGTARQMSRADQCRIGRVMKDLGFKKHRPLVGGSRTYMYTRDYKDSAERMRDLGLDKIDEIVLDKQN
jgi:predicted P-loop ATPase